MSAGEPMLTRRVLVALIVVATALFVVGTTIEHNQSDKHGAAEAGGTTQAANGEAGHSEQGEAAHSGNEGAAPAAAAESTGHHEAGSERILGIDPESPGLIVVAALVSLGLAAAVWRYFGVGWLLLGVGAVMLAFAALDIREVIHQANENRTGLAVLAAAVAALHVMAASVAGLTARHRRDSALLSS